MNAPKLCIFSVFLGIWAAFFSLSGCTPNPSKDISTRNNDLKIFYNIQSKLHADDSNFVSESDILRLITVADAYRTLDSAENAVSLPINWQNISINWHIRFPVHPPIIFRFSQEENLPTQITVENNNYVLTETANKKLVQIYTAAPVFADLSVSTIYAKNDLLLVNFSFENGKDLHLLSKQKNGFWKCLAAEFYDEYSNWHTEIIGNDMPVLINNIYPTVVDNDIEYECKNSIYYKIDRDTLKALSLHISEHPMAEKANDSIIICFDDTKIIESSKGDTLFLNHTFKNSLLYYHYEANNKWGAYNNAAIDREEIVLGDTIRSAWVWNAKMNDFVCVSVQSAKGILSKKELLSAIQNKITFSLADIYKKHPQIARKLHQEASLNEQKGIKKWREFYTKISGANY